MKERYLTKSRYQLAMDCPAKLYYTGKKEYANQKSDDPFMLALAEGGFQVGELAKLYFPGGHKIESADYETSVRQTTELLQQDQVIIYEAAVRTENYFIRTDILCQSGNHLDLIEVKAKSIDMSAEDDSLSTKKGFIDAGWKPYLYDVAFQKYVLHRAFPQYTIDAYLMLADKNALCPTDGLNQKFKIVRDKSGRKSVAVSPSLSGADLSSKILCRINVNDYCGQIYAGKDSKEPPDREYADQVKMYADYYERDEKPPFYPSAACASCEFHTTAEDKTLGLKSGFEECWKQTFGWRDKDFEDPTVLDIWDFKKKTGLIAQRLLKIRDLSQSHISPKKDDKPGLSHSERQWLQVKKVRDHDFSAWADIDGLCSAFEDFVYPLHFIDFETTMVAIPFNKGRRPYEGIAFQFSHHIVQKDGRIAHQGQFLQAEPGVFPNYEFLRALKKELDQDSGSIFRYAAHENSFLNHIYRQLVEDENNIPDRKDLIAFIRSISKSTGNSTEKWEGRRNMIDMLYLVKRFYYDPYTNGSNSIKQVLPAILNSSAFLRDKYSQPIYGSKNGIPSLNFRDWQWLKVEQGRVLDPYRQLPKMFQDYKEMDFELLSDNPELCQGGAAMTAYAKLQFEEMSDYERLELKTALLKYCELDTMAMVMIYEAWKDILKI